MVTGHDRLEQLLSGSLPTGVADLDDAQLVALADAVEAAEQRQARALAQASEDGLALIPGILRGPVRKVLFG